MARLKSTDRDKIDKMIDKQMILYDFLLHLYNKTNQEKYLAAAKIAFNSLTEMYFILTGIYKDFGLHIVT